MSEIQYLHFCGGFGADEGKPLRFWELSAIETAHVLHPNATVMLHTQTNSWANAPDWTTVLYYDEAERSAWTTWTATLGAHQSDRVRLLALLKYGGLYQDTDSFMLQNCDHLADLDGVAIPDQGTGNTLISGFIYAGTNRQWLKELYDRVDNYSGTRYKSWLATSCEIYTQLLKDKTPGLTVLQASLYTCVNWRDTGVFFGSLTPESKQRVDSALVCHAIDKVKYKQKLLLMDEPPVDSVYEYILNKQQTIVEEYMQTVTVRMTTEAMEAMVDGKLGSVEDLVYDFLNLPQPEDGQTKVGSYKGVNILVFEGDIERYFAICPVHPNLSCSAVDAGTAWQNCCDKIDEMLDVRSITKAEQVAAKSLDRGIEALFNLQGKDAVVSLGRALAGCSSADVMPPDGESPYLLASKMALGLQLNAKTQAWARTNLCKYPVATSKIENCVLRIEQMCKMLEAHQAKIAEH